MSSQKIGRIFGPLFSTIEPTSTRAINLSRLGKAKIDIVARAAAMSEEFYIPEIAVAAVDILGFTKLAMRADECRKAMRVLSQCMGNGSEFRMYTSPTLNGPFVATHAEDNYCGDSIYLHADPHFEMRVQILRLMDLVPEDSFFR